MSVLETPRIYFKGEVAWDPITTNNYDSNYNEDTGETVYPAVTTNVKAFRAQAIAEVGSMGNWNPHGTHRVTFFNSAVCGFDAGAGTRTDDPFMNAAASLRGMLVDLEPYGAFSSQLFFDAIRFGVDGGYRILAPRTSRMTARYLNFGRNKVNTMIAGVASVVWQASFAKTDGLRVDPFDSAALSRVARALDNDDVVGLTIRFNAYRTIYYDNPNLTNTSPDTAAAAKALIVKLNEGGFQPNPARCLMVGVIGLWRKGEPEHEPGDRALIQVANSPVASAHVRVGGTALALDLSNSVPEVDKNLAKQNLGVLSVVAVDPGTQAVTNIASFGYSQYDRAAYEATAGIVTVPLGSSIAEALANKDIQIRDSSGNQLLAELPLRSIPATPNLYLDEGDQVNATYQVYERGAPAATVALSLYQMDAAGGQPTSVTQMSTDANGVLTQPITASQGSIIAYVPSFSGADQPTQGINPQVNTYMYVRVRPADTAIAESAPTWENVFVKVLANWNAMAPCMDNWLKLDDPVQVKSYGPVLKRLTDPANFESFVFMPVTRDMSAGQRTLLYRFLDSEPARALAKAEAERPRTLADMSRSMRRM
jgi:hypothetical protein